MMQQTHPQDRQTKRRGPPHTDAQSELAHAAAHPETQRNQCGWRGGGGGG